ncbi:MFS transporter [Micromonospora chersina]|uniref:MFS transporter n=1 Tax=Micromonospora chersina TaxID=47854 RepID=UPI0033E70ABC
MGARDTIRTAVRHVVPPAGLTRALAVQAMVFAVGNGLFQAGSAVFFTRALGLSAAQVGLGLSVAAGVSLLGTVPLGGLTDRYGPQRVWVAGLLLDAALFATYPFVGGFLGFLAVVVALALVGTATGTARQVYSINALPAAERVTAMAYQRSLLNVGFGLGSVLSGLVLAVDTMAAYRGMVWFIAAVFLVTAVFVRRLPRLPEVTRPAEPMSRFAVLRDRPFMTVSLLSGLLTAHQTLYLTVLPLWIITHTDAPKILIAGLVLFNTVLIVLLQVRASRGADTASGAARASRRGALLIALFCVVVPVSGATRGTLTVLVLVAAATLLIVAELVESAGTWGLSATLPPAAQRGAYVGALGLGTQVQFLIAPAGLTALGVSTGGWGWYPAAAIFTLVGLALVPAVARAERTPRLGDTVPATPGSVTPVP